MLRRHEGASVLSLLCCRDAPLLSHSCSPRTSPPSPHHLEAADRPITGWLFHHSLQLPLSPPLVSLAQNKAAGVRLALALMGQLDLGWRHYKARLRVELCPSSGLSVGSHSSSRASPTSLEPQLALPTYTALSTARY